MSVIADERSGILDLAAFCILDVLDVDAGAVVVDVALVNHILHHNVRGGGGKADVGGGPLPGTLHLSLPHPEALVRREREPSQVEM